MATYPMSVRMTSQVPYFERLLRRIDAAGQPIYRMAIGFLVVPVFARTMGAGADWRLVPFFLAVLAAVRVVPALLRHTLPFPSDLKAYWFQQRALAKRYDSYQWQKVFWFGAGLTAYLALVDPGNDIAAALAAVCLGAGALGLVFWHRVGRRLAAATAPQGR